jgi:hypothetical protein
MKKSITLLVISLFLFQKYSHAQVIEAIPVVLNWKDDSHLNFEGADHHPDFPGLPLYTTKVNIKGKAAIELTITDIVADTLYIEDEVFLNSIPSRWINGSGMVQERGQYVATIWALPVQKIAANQILRLKSFVIRARITPTSFTSGQRNGPEFKTESVLASGIIHRVAVADPGVYKIDYNFIKDKLKVDPAGINTNKIGIFGNGGGRVPQWNAAPRTDDLEQVASYAFGLDDGQFNQGDYLLWYAEGAHSWTFDTLERVYQMELNNYDEVNHYYIIIGGPERINMGTRPNHAEFDYVSSTSLASQRIEEELVNLLGRYRPPGSGQEWYGDEMALVKELDYTNKFDVRDLVPSDTLHYKLRFAARSSNLTRFYLKIDQKDIGKNVGGVDLGNYESSFANDAILQGKFIPGQPVQSIRVRYPDANGVNSRGWVDYLQLNFWKTNTYRQGRPLLIRDTRTSFKGTPQYVIDNGTSGSLIWDVTDPFQPTGQEYVAGSQLSFSVEPDADLPRQFLCFNPATDVFTPVYEKEIAHQNLHGIQRADLAILYYDEFEEAATKLAEHRQLHSGLEVVKIPVSQVFEEFGGGSRDPSAMRDFARMLYKRDTSFNYLCFVGDASYDYLNHFTELPYQNFVPAFETEESLDPIRSFPSDDYFALLDDDEGDNLIGAIDIAVGRFPVSAPDEALRIVEKVIHYDEHPATLKDWRNRIVMVADDEDGNIHLNQADGLANKNALEHPDLNIQKLYLDAFPQESTPGGDRYPAVNDAIDLNMNKGALTVTYMGHGGPNGWSQERVLGINQAQSYDNYNNMPLYITATCSFAGYDEPGFVSAGEHLLLNAEGGAVALMTTVRAVYSGSNERLTRAVLDQLYTPDSPGNYPAFAEVLRRAKNVNAIDTLDNNARKFTLLGDPAQKLAIPNYNVQVTEIGGKPVSSGIMDTLSALEKTTISGIITDYDSTLLAGFNGQIYVTLFDKVQVRKTLANDEDSSEKLFTAQTRQLFKGTATVTDGEWSIEFVLPKDIDFAYGAGKLSLYAENGQTDASGYYTGFIVGGVSEGGLTDDLPPVVDLFMNNDQFRSGGITDNSPDIFIKLSDDNGINVSGTSVGHDLEAILDGDEKNSIILNDFYQASLDDYTQGTVRYPLTNLAPGLHTLKVIAWDLANNSGEAYIEFYVLDQESAVVQGVGNYPNPFDELTYFQFEHNRPGVPMDLELNIFDISGKHIKTIKQENYVSDGYRVNDLQWDGRNDGGGDASSGLYVYRLSVTFNNNGIREKVVPDGEKLVIIR